MLIVGLSHHTAPIAVRERLAVHGEAHEQALARFRALDSVCEVVMLSTCNRVEIYAAPVPGIEHVPGISAADRPIYCFGRKADRMRVLIRNANLILDRAERSSA